ncbi:MAG: nucleotide exchange factor GrpE [Anaerolineae bacterium]|nr:nucleotide exchange factor GrpE [Anaerolineae bacterium]
MTISKRVQHIPVRRSGKRDRADTDRADTGRADTGRVDTSNRAGAAASEKMNPSEAQSLSEPDVTASEEASSEVSKEVVDWRDMALRLRAEMDNYRKRQQRLAEEQITAERKRLLVAFLTVLDNLERIVAHLRPDDPYHQSVKVAYDEFLKLLRLEGVEAMDAVGKPFDPLLHDAIAMIPAVDGQREEMLVIDEEQKGYRMGEQILRPARVVVAKR